MVKVDKLIGKTLGELAEQFGVFWKIVRIFVLEDKDDDTGKLLMDAYSIREVVKRFPSFADAEVVIAYDFYGETIIRVRA